MRAVKIGLTIIILAFAAFGQNPDDIIATATGHTVRFRDLPGDIQTAATVHSNPSRVRSALLDEMINQRVLALEAKGRGVSSGRLIATEKAKAAAPTEAEIRAVYNAKRDVIGTRSLDEVRKQIVDYLRGQAEQKLIGAFLTNLRTKYKATIGKDVNTAGLAPTDAVATVNGVPILAKTFEDFARIPLYQDKADLADEIVNEAAEKLYHVLLVDEAKALGVDQSALIAREITDKMKDFSDEELSALTSDLRKRLFAKYQVKFLYKAPEPIVQNVSVGTSPATGSANAPVTIVMFSDFQCKACAATHPNLKKAIAAYPGKIRFVVRNFPLEAVHANAWRAALAAEAAHQQAKFFEYIDILYTHQDTLDDVSLKKYAADLGLNAKQFELDFNSEKTAAAVRKDMADGESYGISSTPTIFVNGISVRDLSVEAFRAAIDRALEKTK